MGGEPQSGDSGVTGNRALHRAPVVMHAGAGASAGRGRSARSHEKPDRVATHLGETHLGDAHGACSSVILGPDVAEGNGPVLARSWLFQAGGLHDVPDHEPEGRRGHVPARVSQQGHNRAARRRRRRHREDHAGAQDACSAKDPKPQGVQGEHVYIP